MSETIEGKRILVSPLTKKYYRVFEWEETDEGKFKAHRKEAVTCDECDKQLRWDGPTDGPLYSAVCPDRGETEVKAP